MKPCSTCSLGAHSAAALAMVALVWDSLKPDNGDGRKDRRRTEWGTKTRCGLAACFDRLIEENPITPKG